MPIDEAIQTVYNYSLQDKEDLQIKMALYSLIKNIRIKEKAKEKILQNYIGKVGLQKIYQVFNKSQNSQLRKLAGRLLCEITFESDGNQHYLCEMFSFNPVNGKVCLNAKMPEQIKNRLQQDPSYLEIMKNHQDQDENTIELHRYWCFPSFEKNQQRIGAGIFSIEDESIEDYLQFPDPLTYMIGFHCGYSSNSQRFRMNQQQQLKQQTEFPSTSNNSINDGRTLLSSNMKQQSNQKSKFKPALNKIIKKTIVKQNSRNSTFGMEGNNMGGSVQIKSIAQQYMYSTHQKGNNQNELISSKDSTSRKRKRKQQSSNYLEENINSTLQSNKKLYSLEQESKEEEESQQQQNVSSPMKGLLKKLNKPEMLLLNHLQNQIKQYYPEQMNKHLILQYEEEFGQFSSQQTDEQIFQQIQDTSAKNANNYKQHNKNTIKASNNSRRQSEYHANLPNSLHTKGLIKFMETSPKKIYKQRRSVSNNKEPVISARSVAIPYLPSNDSSQQLEQNMLIGNHSVQSNNAQKEVGGVFNTYYEKMKKHSESKNKGMMETQQLSTQSQSPNMMKRVTRVSYKKAMLNKQNQVSSQAETSTNSSSRNNQASQQQHTSRSNLKSRQVAGTINKQQAHQIEGVVDLRNSNNKSRQGGGIKNSSKSRQKRLDKAGTDDIVQRSLLLGQNANSSLIGNKIKQQVLLYKNDSKVNRLEMGNDQEENVDSYSRMNKEQKFSQSTYVQILDKMKGRLSKHGFSNGSKEREIKN